MFSVDRARQDVWASVAGTAEQATCSPRYTAVIRRCAPTWPTACRLPRPPPDPGIRPLLCCKRAELPRRGTGVLHRQQARPQGRARQRRRPASPYSCGNAIVAAQTPDNDIGDPPALLIGVGGMPGKISGKGTRTTSAPLTPQRTYARGAAALRRVRGVAGSPIGSLTGCQRSPPPSHTQPHQTS